MKNEYNLKKLKKIPTKVRTKKALAKVTIRNIVKGYDAEIKFSKKDNAFVVKVPKLKGCSTHGETFDEAKKMAKEAIKLYLKTEKAEKTRKRKVRTAFDKVLKMFPKTLKNLAK